MIFETRQQRERDASEIRSLYSRYGDEVIGILRTRAHNRSLSDRDRKHWKRLFSKAKSNRPVVSNFFAIEQH